MGTLIVKSFGWQNFYTLHLEFLGSAHVVLLRSSRWDIRFWQSKCLLESSYDVIANSFQIDRYIWHTVLAIYWSIVVLNTLCVLINKDLIDKDLYTNRHTSSKLACNYKSIAYSAKVTQFTLSIPHQSNWQQSTHCLLISNDYLSQLRIISDASCKRVGGQVGGNDGNDKSINGAVSKMEIGYTSILWHWSNVAKFMVEWMVRS